MQLYELSEPGGLRQVSALPEPVAAAQYLPGGDRAIVEVDSGGDERYQLYSVDMKGEADGAPTGFAGLTVIATGPDYVHRFAGGHPDGDLVAYLSNRRNGVDFDLWLHELRTGNSRLLYDGGGWCNPASGFSPDGRWISVLRPGPRSLDTDLLLIDVVTDEVRVVLEHPDEAAEVGAPAWVDATTFFVSSNVGSDHAAVVRHDLMTGRTTPVADTGRRWDAHPATDRYGKTLLVVENVNGTSRMRLFDPRTVRQLADVPLVEPGVVVSHTIPPPMLSAA